MSLIRTSCDTCDEPLFWGDDSKTRPECSSCRDIRESASSGTKVVLDDEAVYDAIPTLRKSRYLTT